MYYLGIDGGGSKTAFLMVDRHGKPVCRGTTSGCAYPELGITGAVEVIRAQLHHMLEESGLRPEQITGAAAGLPCYGEDPKADLELLAEVKGLLPGARWGIYNDVELGWAGSLGLQAGIHVVAGTGAIVYGRDSQGHSARANGWHEDFSDEGSGYWLGLQALSLFVKEKDGRLPRSPLYETMKEALGETEQEAFVPLYVKNYQGRRNRVAALQLALLKAAKRGDEYALQLYDRAAEELAAGVRAVSSKLEFPQGKPVPVSYSGGIFQGGEIIRGPLEQRLEGMGFVLQEPLMDPVRGGVLLAAYQVEPGLADRIREWLGESQIKKMEER